MRLSCIGLGPGFEAGVDVHAVVETNRGHHLGRVLWHGSAEPDTGVPGEIAGQGPQRLLRAPHRACFGAKERLEIGLKPARWSVGLSKHR